MNLKYILNTVGFILKYLAVILFVPVICALILKEYYSVIPFLATSLISYLLSLGFAGKSSRLEELNNINRGETLAIVLLTWIILSLLSALTFLFFGLKPIDALFESVSGVTTTGATVITDFSLYPKTMFFWRSFSQWLGGMGILVLFIAILPQFAIAGRQMFYAESPGASSTDSKLTPRIRKTSAALWGIYLVLTVLEIIILISSGMSVFDSICNSFATLAGGGFSPAQQSIMQYAQSKYIWIITIFMFLSGMNFALQYKIYIKHDFKSIFKDEEFKLYFLIVGLFSIFIALTLFTHHIYNASESIRAALFQVISVITTTGFASVDFNEWNLRAKIMLFMLMFCGASIGSASGGLKLLRIIFIFKYLKRQIAKIFHPNGVYPVKINRTIMSEDNVRQMISFVIFYYAIFVVTAFLLVFIEQNVSVGVSGAIATLGNVGPGFSQIGPMESYQELHFLSKLICIFNMLIGRLELVPFLALLHPDFWSYKKVK